MTALQLQCSYLKVRLHVLRNYVLQYSFCLGTHDFVSSNPEIMTVSLESGHDSCRKDTGEMRKLRLWSRGHVFIVRSCGFIDMWKPIYR